MTEIEKKALALVNEVYRDNGEPERDWAGRHACAMHEALCRAIGRHEKFRQEVSDEIVRLGCWPDTVNLQRFIIAKHDPLVEILTEISGEGGFDNYDHYAYRIRSALEARGLKIVEAE